MNKEIEEASKTTPLGYIPYMGEYDNFVVAGHVCMFEYCIETFPLEEGSKIACPLFGHDCPGGDKYLKMCEKVYESGYIR